MPLVFAAAMGGNLSLIGGFLFYATVGFKILPNHDTVDTENSIFDESKDFSQVPKWKKSAVPGHSDCYDDRNDF